MVVQDEFRPHELERQSPQQQDVGWVSGVDVIDPGPPGEGDEDAGDVPRRGGELAGVGADRADSGGQAEAVDRDAVDDLMSRVVALLEAQVHRADRQHPVSVALQGQALGPDPRVVGKSAVRADERDRRRVRLSRQKPRLTAR